MKKYILPIGILFTILILNACTALDTSDAPTASQPQPSATKTETIKHPKPYVKPLAKFIPNETKGIVYYTYNYEESSSTFFLYDPQLSTTTEFLKVKGRTSQVQYNQNHLYLNIGPRDKDEYSLVITDYSLQDQTYTTIPMQPTYQQFYVTPTNKIIYPVLDSDNSTTIVVYDINEKTTKNWEILDKYVLENINSEGFFIESYDDKPDEISILTGYWEIGAGSAIRFDLNIDTGKISNIKESSNDEVCIFGVTGAECTEEQSKEANDFSDFLGFLDKPNKCLDYLIEEEPSEPSTFLIKKDNTEKRIEDATYLGCVE
ncbi:MAG: hypothetical protein AAB848_02740 [Patescibacteria group bacterium]